MRRRRPSELRRWRALLLVGAVGAGFMSSSLAQASAAEAATESEWMLELLREGSCTVIIAVLVVLAFRKLDAIFDSAFRLIEQRDRAFMQFMTTALSIAMAGDPERAQEQAHELLQRIGRQRE